MLIDSRTLPPDEVIDADVCIVGGGPAGLTLAREFAGLDLRVALLDSGGDGTDPAADAAAQDLSHGEVVGDRYEPLTEVRHRGLGGSAALWDYLTDDGRTDGVRLRPLDEIEFRPRPWLPHSGWPFDRAHLDPFYERAQSAMGVGRFGPDVTVAPDGAAPAAFPLAVGSLVASEFRFATAAGFLDAHLPPVRSSRAVTTYVYATVVELDCSADPSTVGSALVESTPGRRFGVRARHFVLAAGGIENARLLLQSNSTHAAGVGNQHDLVGRHFMDHPHVYGGFLRPFDPGIVPRLLSYEAHDDDGVTRLFKVCLSQDVLDREQILNSWTSLHPRPHARFRAATESARRLAAAARSRDRSAAGLGDLRAVGSGMGHVLPAMVNKVRLGHATSVRQTLPEWTGIRPGALIEGFELTHAVEQAPDPDTRITLGAGRDRFGRPVPRLHFRWSDLDVDSVRRTNALVAKELSTAGIGELEIEPGRGLPETGVSGSPHHHIGTTRMHTDPRQGVVDADGRVHGMANLHIAGSSVFPTGGAANPTLTIVAMAMRLADHLRAVLKAG